MDKYNQGKCVLVFETKSGEKLSKEYKGSMFAAYGRRVSGEMIAHMRLGDIFSAGFVEFDKRYIPISEIKEIVKTTSDYWVDKEDKEVPGE